MKGASRWGQKPATTFIYTPISENEDGLLALVYLCMIRRGNPNNPIQI
jgi:hypothetical protein